MGQKKGKKKAKLNKRLCPQFWIWDVEKYKMLSKTHKNETQICQSMDKTVGKRLVT